MEGNFENESKFWKWKQILKLSELKESDSCQVIFRENLTPLCKEIVVKVVRLFAVFLFLHSYASCTTKVILVAGST